MKTNENTKQFPPLTKNEKLKREKEQLEQRLQNITDRYSLPEFQSADDVMSYRPESQERNMLVSVLYRHIINILILLVYNMTEVLADKNHHDFNQNSSNLKHSDDNCNVIFCNMTSCLYLFVFEFISKASNPKTLANANLNLRS